MLYFLLIVRIYVATTTTPIHFSKEVSLTDYVVKRVMQEEDVQHCRKAEATKEVEAKKRRAGLAG